MQFEDIDINVIRQMLQENEEDRLFGKNVTTQLDNPEYHPIKRGANDKTVFQEMMMDPYYDGYVMKYPDPVGVVIRQPRRKYYYRGESQLYPTTMSTLGRLVHETKSAQGKEVEKLVADIKLHQFVRQICRYENVKAFENLGITVQYQAIAQHYGFRTYMMDITSDFEVALFFACCKFDSRTRSWRPLATVDTEVAEEKKYGIIFRRAVLPWSMLPDEGAHPIFPIGYQPFIRCSNQTGFTIPMYEGDDLKTLNLPGMQMLRFRHNPDLSQWIYDKMKGGNLIYSRTDVLEGVAGKLEEFVKSMTVDRSTLLAVLAANKVYHKWRTAKWLHAIQHHGYTICDNPLPITVEEDANIQEQLQGFDIESFYRLKLQSRPMYSGPITIVDGKNLK